MAGSFVFEFIFPQLVEVYPRIASLNGLESVNFVVETSPQFLEDFKRRFGEAAPQFADYAYDAAAMIKRCGVDRECLVSKADGVSGPIAFGVDGRRVGRFESKQLMNGKFEALMANNN